jgi:hypothetical protein
MEAIPMSGVTGGRRKRTTSRIEAPALSRKGPVHRYSPRLPAPRRLSTQLRSVGVIVWAEIVLPARNALAFRFEIEHADLKNIPDFVDNALVHHVNTALYAERARLVWPFAKTLGFSFPIPPPIEPASGGTLKPTSGVLTISPEALSLAVEIEAAIFRTGTAVSDGGRP